MKTLSIILGSLFALNASANSMVVANNKIGLKLAFETAKTLKGKNYMISPLSLQQALNLAGNGTNSQTRQSFESLLGDNVEGINYQSQELVKDISFSKAEATRIRTQAPYANPAIVSINNSIWNTNSATAAGTFKFSEQFKSVAKEYYSAEAFTVDFMKPEAVKAINGWAEQKTYGLVKEIIDLPTLQPMLWAIMNATYIEANWREPFYKLSDAQAFTTLDKNEVKVPMISSTQYIEYANLPEGEIANIPFSSVQDGPELEFRVFLPSVKADFAKSQEYFFSESFVKKTKSLFTRVLPVRAKVILPKFSFDTSVEMKKDEAITKAMGLNFLFQDNADFSLIVTQDSLPSAIGLIKQNSRIELDEKGVKAAAVTIIGGVRTTSVPVEPSTELRVNRPFMFTIVEKKSGSILFAGSVIRP